MARMTCVWIAAARDAASLSGEGVARITASPAASAAGRSASQSVDLGRSIGRAGHIGRLLFGKALARKAGPRRRAYNKTRKTKQ